MRKTRYKSLPLLVNAVEDQTQGRVVYRGALKHSKESLNADGNKLGSSPSGDSETSEIGTMASMLFEASKQFRSGKSRSDLEKVP